VRSGVDACYARAVEAIYAAAPEPARWPAALDAIAACFGDVGCILIYGRDDGAFGVVESPALSPMLPEYHQKWARRDTRAIRSRERGYFVRRDVITDRDCVSDAEMEADPFYCDFLRRFGLKFFAAAMVSPDPHVEVALSVQRALGKPPYTEGELDLLGKIGGHVEQSLRLGIRLLDSELINVGLGAALARIGIGVFVLDTLHRVVFSNHAGQKLIGHGPSAGDDAIFMPALEIAEVRRALDAAVSGIAAMSMTDTRPLLIQRPQSARPLALYILPIAEPFAVGGKLLTRARAIVLVIDPDTSSPPDPALIRDLLGLTLSEARIASLVGTGMSPRDTAAKLGISEETARTALKRVFAKVGVSRQSELAALMVKLILV
jgi:DNA-binding CsgD family transcriptional regulator